MKDFWKYYICNKEFWIFIVTIIGMLLGLVIIIFGVIGIVIGFATVLEEIKILFGYKQIIKKKYFKQF